MRPIVLSGMLTAAALLAACTATAPAPSAQAAADDNLNAVLWMQRAEEYRANALSLYRAAGAQLDAALADPEHDALIPAERALAGPLDGLPAAVIVDIDETVLDNSPYQARLLLDGQHYAQDTWAAWVEEQAAAPMPGALAFAQAAQEKGITMIYLSNRSQTQQQATLANLRAAGFPAANDAVFLGKGYVVDGCEPIGSGKSCRRQWVGRHYRVLMQVGDQLGDFIDPADNSPAARAAALDAHADWFGERWWMLANPSYGHWEAAQLGNEPDLSRSAQRSRKRAALHSARP